MNNEERGVHCASWTIVCSLYNSEPWHGKGLGIRETRKLPYEHTAWRRLACMGNNTITTTTITSTVCQLREYGRIPYECCTDCKWPSHPICRHRTFRHCHPNSHGGCCTPGCRTRDPCSSRTRTTCWDNARTWPLTRRREHTHSLAHRRRRVECYVRWNTGRVWCWRRRKCLQIGVGRFVWTRLSAPPLCGLILAQRICSCKVEIFMASKDPFSPLLALIWVRSTGRVSDPWTEVAMIVNGAARPLVDTVVAVGKGSIYRNDAVFVFHTFG